MSILIDKSLKNLNAANRLNELGLYCSVPHCAYYSCFQLMIEIESAELLENIGENSHNKMIKMLICEMKKQNNYFESVTFNTNIRKLKRIRHEADYKKVEIKINDSENSIKLAKETISLLRKVFNINDCNYGNI